MPLGVGFVAFSLQHGQYLVATGCLLGVDTLVDLFLLAATLLGLFPQRKQEVGRLPKAQDFEQPPRQFLSGRTVPDRREELDQPFRSVFGDRVHHPQGPVLLLAVSAFQPTLEHPFGIESIEPGGGAKHGPELRLERRLP